MAEQEANKPKYEYLAGNVERITYHNQDNGFVVLRVKVKKRKDLVSVTGTIPSISVGEDIKAQGFWHNHREYGLGFKAEFIRSIPPSTLEGLEKYLGSGLIKGIGAYLAGNLVKSFGENVFDVIENSPDKLLRVDGIGHKRVDYITKNWAEQKIVREIMVFLQSNGIGTSRATKIYKTYGEDAIKLVSQNPYQLSRDIRGIGFISADNIAKNLGIEPHSIIRARAGINHTLMESSSEGHIALPRDFLIKKAESLLSIPESILEGALSLELAESFVTADTIEDKEFIFLTSYYYYERNMANRLQQINKQEPTWGKIDIEKAIPWVEEKLKINLADNQKEAVKLALSSRICVITGGPGTGKTTILKCILSILNAKKLEIKLCAPTGRAAKRLSETTGMPAYTIHRLLKFNPQGGGFHFHQDNRIECDLLIADESSMIDVQLMSSLLKALPDNAGLIIVGDVDQLPSVGAGQVLKDIIDSEVIPTQRLTEIYRQAEDSDIIVNAHLINKGLMPRLKPTSDYADFYFIECDDVGAIGDKIKYLVKERIPRRFGFNSIKDIQVLSPMQRGGCGARSLNIELQQVLNPSYLDGIEKYGQRYSINDKVMQIENNYDKEVYNGDIGYISGVDTEEQVLQIDFDGHSVSYDFADLDEITLSYATTIHKSQGSEYPAVVIPIATQHYMMLKKNLLYTGITRGRKLVVLVGQKKAVAMAVKNKEGGIRNTKLKEWLHHDFAEALL